MAKQKPVISFIKVPPVSENLLKIEDSQELLRIFIPKDVGLDSQLYTVLKNYVLVHFKKLMLPYEADGLTVPKVLQLTRE